MDHIRSLERFRINHAPLVQIPWLGYDHETHPICAFGAWPQCRGWNASSISTLSNLDDINPKLAISIAMLQAWLFVGFLEDLFERRIKKSEFVIQTRKRALVSTKLLLELFEEWSLKVEEMSDGEREGRAKHSEGLLKELQFWCFKLSSLDHPSLNEVPWETRPDYERRVIKQGEVESDIGAITRLATLIGEAVNTLKARLNTGGRINTSTGFVGAYSNYEQKRLVSQLMRAGWCPFMARVLFTYRYTIAEFAAFWPEKGKGERHAACTPRLCRGYNVEPGSYQPKHKPLTCACPYIIPDLAEIERILRDGGIPLIGISTLSENGHEGMCAKFEDPSTPWDNEVRLTVIAASKLAPHQRYAAISHVWSDGMGSRTEEGLPRCIVRKVYLTIKAYGHSYFWMDSLCVPWQLESRRQALRLMAKTYQDAFITVVFDASISKIPFTTDPEDMENILLRIVTSPWMQRLWTLQEAVLSRWLVFQFRDQLASALDIWSAVVISTNHGANPIVQVLANEFLKLLKHRSEFLKIPSQLELGDIYRMLRIRTTSRASDETHAIAGLFGLDALALLREPPDTRLMKFFQMIKSVPSDIVFLKRKRMEADGFRWAPKSMLISDDETTAADDHLEMGYGNRHLAECLEGGGLVGRYHMLKLSKTASLKQSFYVDDIRIRVDCSTTTTTSSDVDPLGQWNSLSAPSILDRSGSSRILTVTAADFRSTSNFEFDAIVLHSSSTHGRPITLGAALLSKPFQDGLRVPAYTYKERVLPDLDVGGLQKTESHYPGVGLSLLKIFPPETFSRKKRDFGLRRSNEPHLASGRSNRRACGNTICPPPTGASGCRKRPRYSQRASVEIGFSCGAVPRALARWPTEEVWRERLSARPNRPWALHRGLRAVECPIHFAIFQHDVLRQIGAENNKNTTCDKERKISHDTCVISLASLPTQMDM
ncbi:hypothetical protein EJ04DRAFT_605798 [Polyplosphaeria fusca]|uniref:Heterokaryon incompatibility domain-containing protein n=1 Tax=Polyplosphaeria fusca TaxID=682080 RepID=A0A9P4QVP4_9PLEO|nr:hypothetical protein EJ04DRAFT_605798 [Polyplosphaeria fusca]